MKKSYFAYLLPILLSSCVESVLIPEKGNGETEISTRSSGQEGDLFYYYFDEKVYLTQRTDQVFLKFASDATKEQYHAVAQSNTLSQKVNANGNFHFIEGRDFNTLIIETPQSTDALTSLKTRKEIASATYMLDNNGKMSAYTDEFSVKLKRGTSFAQLQELAKNNNCIVSEHEWFGENEFMITVSKTSDLDAVRMACLFYETELFEFTAPNFVSFNALDSYDTHFAINGT